MSCPIPEYPGLRANMKSYLPPVIKFSLLIWFCNVLYLYSALAYPHKAFLFHLHTVFATILVVLITFSVLWSLQSAATSIQTKQRRQLLDYHRYAMLTSVLLTFCTAALMVLKKSWYGNNGWLFIDRTPSYHSWAAVVWMFLVIPFLTITGMIVHQTKPPQIVEVISKIIYGSVGKGRKNLKNVHKLSGLIALTVIMVVAMLGLSEKNDDANKHAMAWMLVGIWLLVGSQKALM